MASTTASLNRWNALAIVLRANKESSELGDHIATAGMGNGKGHLGVVDTRTSPSTRSG